MSVIRLRVQGQFDGAREATVEIDRKSLLVTVRPLRRREAAGPIELSVLANVVISMDAKAKVAERRGRVRRAVKRGLL